MCQATCYIYTFFSSVASNFKRAYTKVANCPNILCTCGCVRTDEWTDGGMDAQMQILNDGYNKIHYTS